jgi:hypothetical protein
MTWSRTRRCTSRKRSGSRHRSSASSVSRARSCRSDAAGHGLHEGPAAQPGEQQVRVPVGDGVARADRRRQRACAATSSACRCIGGRDLGDEPAQQLVTTSGTVARASGGLRIARRPRRAGPARGGSRARRRRCRRSVRRGSRGRASRRPRRTAGGCAARWSGPAVPIRAGRASPGSAPRAWRSPSASVRAAVRGAHRGARARPARARRQAVEQQDRPGCRAARRRGRPRRAGRARRELRAERKRDRPRRSGRRVAHARRPRCSASTAIRRRSADLPMPPGPWRKSTARDGSSSSRSSRTRSSSASRPTNPPPALPRHGRRGCRPRVGAGRRRVHRLTLPRRLELSTRRACSACAGARSPRPAADAHGQRRPQERGRGREHADHPQVGVADDRVAVRDPPDAHAVPVTPALRRRPRARDPRAGGGRCRP